MPVLSTDAIIIKQQQEAREAMRQSTPRRRHGSHTTQFWKRKAEPMPKATTPPTHRKVCAGSGRAHIREPNRSAGRCAADALYGAGTRSKGSGHHHDGEATRWRAQAGIPPAAVPKKYVVFAQPSFFRGAKIIHFVEIGIKCIIDKTKSTFLKKGRQRTGKWRNSAFLSFKRRMNAV